MDVGGHALDQFSVPHLVTMNSNCSETMSDTLSASACVMHPSLVTMGSIDAVDPVSEVTNMECSPRRFGDGLILDFLRTMCVEGRFAPSHDRGSAGGVGFVNKSFSVVTCQRADDVVFLHHEKNALKVVR